ncbi:hypothetical protein [Streptomyces sp. TR06-5]|uniref:DUF7847 domain-containing protein n=1 Tax=unclassified Streptomyces TaxID=2593676 RepID=UPI0039A151DF
MNDSPGWASPGSAPSDPEGDRDGNPSADPAGGAPEHHDRWADRQPPPAAGQDWGTSAPPPPGPPGPGQPTGWGAAKGWSRPAAAKPGVIPLRPLGIGEIFDGAVSTARTHWRTALGVALGVAVLVQPVRTLADGVSLRAFDDLTAMQNDPQPDTGALLDVMTATMGSAGAAMLVTLVGTVVATAMLTVVVSRAVLGRPVSLPDTWREARPRLLGMLGLTLLMLLVVLFSVAVGTLPGLLVAAAGSAAEGSLLAVLGGLGGVVLGIWLWVLFCLAPPALMLEKQGVVTALRRSAKLVRGTWWRIFGIQVLALLLVQAVGSLVQMPFSLIGIAAQGNDLGDLFNGSLEVSWPYLIALGVGAVLAMTVTLPLNAGITALLYVDQRIRREALDLEIARAAGIDHDSAPPPTPAGS